MRWSRAFIPTLRDNPANTERPSQRLLIRGGFIRQTGGTFTYLPLGCRTVRKIVRIVREEMEAAGAQEFFLPPDFETTHKEIITEIARGEIRSYRDLPQIWFRIQPRSQCEDRAIGGPLRPHLITMCDSCSFDVDPHGLERSHQSHHDAFCRILERCGVKHLSVDSSPGAPQGCRARDFLVPMGSAESTVLVCQCGYAATPECARSKIPKIEDLPASGEPREVHTPGKRTIAEVAEFLKVPATRQIKSLVYLADGRPCLLLLRGDHQLSEAKAVAALQSARLRPALPEEIQAALGADAGSLGPMGSTGMPLYADLELKGRQNLACGANRNDYHLLGVTPDIHFQPFWADLRTAVEDEACVQCGSSLRLRTASCVGRLRPSGPSADSGLAALLADGKTAPILVGTYEMMLDNIMLSAVELRHDADGIIWPPSIAPFTAVITPINYKGEVKAAADRIYADLKKAGVDTLLDDREERPGVKFKDADLIGPPYRIVLGPEKVRQGKGELFTRATKTVVAGDFDWLISAVRSMSVEGDMPV